MCVGTPGPMLGLTGCESALVGGSLGPNAAELPGSTYLQDVGPVKLRPNTCIVAQAMSSNYFLWIIVIVSALAVASKLTGAL